MERDCNKCVYSTRDGNCSKWECKGTTAVEDIKHEAIREFECPTCESKYYASGIKGLSKGKYCEECGQKLDWT